MSKPAAQPCDPQPYDPPPYDPEAIFQDNSPINPGFMHEAVRTLMRALPLEDPAESQESGYRRMYSTLRALSALHPRDEIEVMLGVQAVSAYHAAAACWRIGMNLRRPHGDSTRHITTAASAARTFDTLLRAIERRQAKPLSVPVGRPAPRLWNDTDPTHFMQAIEHRCRPGSRNPGALNPGNTAGNDLDNGPQPAPPTQWTPASLAITRDLIQRERTEAENHGLDIANIQGILPGGGMIMPEDPTAQQAAYIGRRLGLMYKREYAENLRNGVNKYPKIRPVRPGDLIP